MPSGGVCGVLSRIPRICPAAASAPAGSSATFTPPAFPRPPAWTWAFTTTRPPRRSAIARASAGRGGNLPPRNGNAELPEDRLRLVLVDLHGSAGMR